MPNIFFLSLIQSINYLAMSGKWNCIDDEISRIIKRFLCKKTTKDKTLNKMKKNMMLLLFSTSILKSALFVCHFLLLLKMAYIYAMPEKSHIHSQAYIYGCKRLKHFEHTTNATVTFNLSPFNLSEREGERDSKERENPDP